MTLEQYLIDVGIRASDWSHVIDEEERKLLKDNVDYKALIFFNDYLKGDYDI